MWVTWVIQQVRRIVWISSVFNLGGADMACDKCVLPYSYQELFELKTLHSLHKENLRKATEEMHRRAIKLGRFEEKYKRIL